ncbi:hypothetical protein M427DRAFT_110612 [Gonapodya prolifera JEL478]|uniref:GH26 domain-containing protein n=1 Tax=Gonapodya prolifera (strain JEL478) TaxID=1344416 RepID=A0A139AL73_GONPJ|nr:hypothetical protein M427DRAFT_110612 [Gonapodya prolifera JEL478]|eukprot:KXS17165.1 hypothetical protein M427DRAFT_110612 [Gonapodya prolifera JEL478]
MMVGMYESTYDFPATIYSSKARFDNYTQDFGWDPSVMHVFGNLPFRDGYDIPLLTDFLTRCAERGIVALTSMEPWQGLDNVTDSVAATFADLCARFEPGNFTNGPGTACLVRFALEFNGPFHPVWMWQPTAHKAAFRRVANALHSRTKLAGIMWGPNSGLGYPWAFQLDPNNLTTLSAVDRAALDTNKDGKIDNNDDPYQPWWPGAEYVDWIAMTAKHWNTDMNVEAPAQLLNTLIDAPYAGGTVQSFYQTYAAGFNLPMAMPDTGATYVAANPGVSGVVVKGSWMEQLYNTGNTYNFGTYQSQVPHLLPSGAIDPAYASNIATKFPLMKMINLYNHYVLDDYSQKLIDWSIRSHPLNQSATDQSQALLTIFRTLVSPQNQVNGQQYFVNRDRLIQLGIVTGADYTKIPQSVTPSAPTPTGVAGGPAAVPPAGSPTVSGAPAPSASSTSTATPAAAGGSKPGRGHAQAQTLWGGIIGLAFLAIAALA